ncbi:hypothetical protein PVL29_006710 [Vitis rotundifolia]|uniref:Aminotransferase-like plant mobile domain-containing protein n=1 Tax=Vitis rotundifolia TaxID=103349 RepID=A0AA39A6R0_VITRO|nr:hypothetical protein PVL29_006710 [Vitis rotundifolia]
MNLNLENPGPCDDSVLIEQHLHVSSAICDRVVRETNSFHVRMGEMTITLENVSLIPRLAIDGDPVVGVTTQTCEWLCQRLLGTVPRHEHKNGGMVKLSWSRESLSRCTEYASEEEVKKSTLLHKAQHTHAYLLYLLGCTIFSSSTSNKVPVIYLQFFENFDDAKSYAWGATVLVYLYRALGNASLNGPANIVGCWSYEHLKVGLPALECFDKPARNFPRALKSRKKQKVYSNNQSLVIYQKSLDTLEFSDVAFCPYINMDYTVIPEQIRRNMYLGRSSTMMILKKWRKSCATDCIDLSKKMEFELKEWEGRGDHIIQGDSHADESRYMEWYSSITHKFIGRQSPVPHPTAQESPYSMLYPTTQQKSSSLPKPTIQQTPSPLPNPATQRISSPLAPTTPQQKSSPVSSSTTQQMPLPLARSTMGPSSPPPMTTTQHSFNPNHLGTFKTSSLLLTENARMSAALWEIAHIVNDFSTEGFDSQQLKLLLRSKSYSICLRDNEVEDVIETEDWEQPLLSHLHYLATTCVESSQNPKPTLDEDPSVNIAASIESSPQPPVQIPLVWPLNGILTQNWIQDVMSALKFPSILPTCVFDSLLVSASRILLKEPNCVKIDCFEGDLDTFTSVGVEGKIRRVILGWGLKTLLLLLVWKAKLEYFDARFLCHIGYIYLAEIMKPSCVSACALEEEVMTKYGDQGTHIYCRCLEYFSKLPLASIIAGSVYTIHGGLFRRMPTAPINCLLVLWKNYPKQGDQFQILKSLGMNLISDALSSDPSIENVLGRIDEGYSINHEKIIRVTNHILSSAPDCPLFNDKGVYIVLKPPTFDDLVFHTFEGATPGAKDERNKESLAGEEKSIHSEICPQQNGRNKESLADEKKEQRNRRRKESQGDERTSRRNSKQHQKGKDLMGEIKQLHSGS